MIPISKGLSRRTVIFIFIGICSCLFISEVNGLLLNITDAKSRYFTINITPITEELIKGIPIYLYAKFISDKDRELRTLAFSVGVGFAVLENIVILMQHYESVDLFFAIVRGFASGLMHSMCTIIIATFLSMIHKNKKVYRCGVITAFFFAVVFHSVFNTLVQADSTALQYVGFLLPICTYLALFVFGSVSKIKEKKKEKSASPADID